MKGQTEFTDIVGRAVISKAVFTKLLAQLEPSELNEKSTVFHIGYEQAKRDITRTLSEAFGPEFARSLNQRLIMELRG